MQGFLGEYEVAMDAKGRFLVPSGFRKQLPDGEGGQFVINRGMEACLNLYTISEWDKLTGKLSRLNDFNPKVQLLKRLMLNGASVLELDSAGRLLLPKALQQHASLQKELVFSANINKVEIWDKDSYYQHLKANSLDLGKLSAEVFGNEFIDPFQ
ncbi:MAG TPA: division/cell wall cluster transcriptional repressor MraZ [Edaphocola sp.]|nr:division/cell wall cluster transcriptional repressor MraZ [Edaphocola sp.]